MLLSESDKKKYIIPKIVIETGKINEDTKSAINSIIKVINIIKCYYYVDNSNSKSRNNYYGKYT